MPYVITISTDGAAFHEDDGTETIEATGAELARILRRLADDLEAARLDHQTLRDVNGNTVGAAELADFDPLVDCTALDNIAAQLTGRTWNGADIEDVAAHVTATGRTIAPPA